MDINYIKFKNEKLTLTKEQMEMLKEKISDYINHSCLRKTGNTLAHAYRLSYCFGILTDTSMSITDLKEAMKQLSIPNIDRISEYNVYYPIPDNILEKIEKDTRMLKKSF